MASSTTCALSSPSSLMEARAAANLQIGVPAPQRVGLPPLAAPPRAVPQSRAQGTGAYCRKIARSVTATATGETMAGSTIATVAAPVEPAAETAVVNGESTEAETAEQPDIVKTIQQAWGKVEDKFAVSALGFSGLVAVFATAGAMSAVDRIPLLPGALELVGIGYTGWFAYKHLIFTPDRKAFLQKVKNIYNDILGSSS